MVTWQEKKMVTWQGFFFGKGIRKERETQHTCSMSAGAPKRARRGDKAEANVAQPTEPIIAYDSDNVAEYGELAQCARVQVLLHDFSRGESARVEVKVWSDADDDMSAPDVKLQKSAKSAAARAAFRAVVRAHNCEMSTKYVCSLERPLRESAFKDFKRQLDDMDKDETVETEDYDHIIKDMKLLETHYKNKAFGK
jgi:hypothetical protein